MRKPVLPYANNKGAEQPAHPRNQISAFVVRILDSIIPLVSISKISTLFLPLIQEEQLSVTGERMCTKTGKLPMRLVQEQCG